MLPLHAGLVCINGPVGMKADLQGELFGYALDEVGLEGDLVNQVVEVFLEDLNSEADLIRYQLPVGDLL